MIIRKLRAENFLKYEQLELTSIPETGCITIRGRNESGKSTIAEAICVALFGRSHALPAEELGKAVRWGTSNATVTLDIFARTTTYSITRHIDADGSQRAKLSRTGKKEPVAQGAEAVNAAITDLAGFDYDQYVEAIYLAQKRVGLAGAGSAAIKAMAGTAQLEQVAQVLRSENDLAEATLHRIEEKHQAIVTQRAELNVRQETLTNLSNSQATQTQEIQALEKEIRLWERFDTSLNDATSRLEQFKLAPNAENLTLEEWQGRANQLQQLLDGYYKVCHESVVEMENDPSTKLRTWVEELGFLLTPAASIMQQVEHYRKRLLGWLEEGPSEPGENTLTKEQVTWLQKSRSIKLWKRLTGFFTLLTLALTMIFGGAWGLLHTQPNHELAQKLFDLLTTLAPDWWNASRIPLLSWVAAGLGVVLLLLFSRLLVQGRQLRGVSAELGQLEKREQEARARLAALRQATTLPLGQGMQQLSQMHDAPWGTYLESWMQGDGAQLVDEASLQAFMNGFKRKMEELRRESDSIRDDVKGQIADSQEALQSAKDELWRLEGAIRVETERRQQDLLFQGQMQAVQSELEQEMRRIRVRHAARHLLRVTARELALHFNAQLRRFLTQTVPLFTEGRYQEVRIGDDLSVEVFSKDKNDFVAMEEISTGVQHQLLLAVRVALAQGLVSRTASGPQFLLLDEPFAFFDSVRLKQTLETLPNLSADLPQIWAVAQEFPAECQTDQTIRCEVGERVLKI